MGLDPAVSLDNLALPNTPLHSSPHIPAALKKGFLEQPLMPALAAGRQIAERCYLLWQLGQATD